MALRDKHGTPLNVGDRVRIVADATPDGRFVGREATIERVRSATVTLDIDYGTWTPEYLERADHSASRPTRRIQAMLQEWHRASSYSSNPGEIIQAGDKLIDALLADADLLNLDTAGSASRQHFIETGRFLFEGEAL